MRTGRKVRIAASRFGRSIIEALEQRELLDGVPAVAWSSYLGGISGETIDDIALDPNGNAWVTGYTSSSGWTSGGFDTSFSGSSDAFVAKINADGTLAWSSYLGGNDYERGYSIAVDASGNAWVVGRTLSSGWVSGGFNSSYGGTGDAFVAKINADGTLAWSSYLGGSSNDFAYAIALDASGNAWVTGHTESSGWTSGGFDTSYNGGNYDAFVAKINADGTLGWSSYLGGGVEDEGRSIALDTGGNAWVVGRTFSPNWTSGGFDTSFNSGPNTYDAFVAKINADGTLAWSSYLGGSGDEGGTYGIALDASGDAWVTGYTNSLDWASGGFDTSYNGGWYDVFLAKISASGTLAWSTYLGGSGDDRASSIALDASGNAWIMGRTTSSDSTGGGFDTSYNGGSFDGFVAQFSADGALAWSSYMGGSDLDFGWGVALDASGNAWVTGETYSTEWTSGGFDTSFNGTEDGFVAKIRLNHAPVAVNLSSSTIAENQRAGTAVGTFSTTDPDSGESFSYSLVSGTDSADNALFTIVGGQLRTAAVFDYETRSRYSIRVRSTDSGGLVVESVFTVSVSDVDEVAPTVAVVAINDGAAQRSMVKRLSVTFSEPVSLAAGAVTVKLASGLTVPNTTITTTNPAGDQRIYLLTFSGTGTAGGSLADGIYDLIVSATGVQDLAGNALAANFSQRFHRLFGDSDGNRIVNALDYARLKQSFGRAPTDPLFNSAFDYEGNGLINALDLARFRQRYGMSYSY